MGAWGMKGFENDGALDWMDALLETEGYSTVAETLDAVIADKCLDEFHCEASIAAAEVVAAAAGAPDQELPEELVDWLARQSQPEPALISKANDVVSAIKAKSGMRQLWEISEHFAQWNASMDDLNKRLGAAKSAKA